MFVLSRGGSGFFDRLSGRHDSKPTNPFIAGAFHWTGAVEVWGSGTHTIPDKPNSRLQKYRLTATGKRLLEKSK